MINRFLVRAAAAAAAIMAFSSPALASTPERNVYYTYDAEGHQLSATFDSTTGTEKITNSYTGFGELRSSTSTSGGAALTLSYLYDADGNRIRLTFPDANFFTYSYDGLDRESGVLQGGTTSLLTITYDQLGRRSLLQRTGAGKTAYAYDNASRLQGLTDQLGTAAGGANDQALTFGYYASDQIRTKTASNTSYSWTSAASTNRPYTINGLNQYTAAGTASFAYDANGNLTQSSSTFYCYDTENRLVGSGASATDCSSLAVLAYDPMGRLVTTQAGGTTTRLVYDGDDLVAEYNSAGTLLRRYLHGPGTDETLIQYEGTGVTPTVERLLYADQHGSIIATTDNAGNLMVNGIDKYDEYGIPQTDSAGHSLNSGRFQYTGQQWIGELGMYYYKARFYSPTLGRFMQTDPIGYDDQINLYAYVGNDPITFVDKTGREKDVYYYSNGQVVIVQTFSNNGTQFTNNAISSEGRNLSGPTSDGSNLTVVLTPGNDRTALQLNPNPNLNDLNPNGNDRSHIDSIGGRNIQIAPNAQSVDTAGHEIGHGLQAGDQYKGGVDANGNTLTADVPGPPNLMKNAVGPANQQTLDEIANQASKGADKVESCDMNAFETHCD